MCGSLGSRKKMFIVLKVNLLIKFWYILSDPFPRPNAIVPSSKWSKSSKMKAKGRKIQAVQRSCETNDCRRRRAKTSGPRRIMHCTSMLNMQQRFVLSTRNDSLRTRQRPWCRSITITMRRLTLCHTLARLSCRITFISFFIHSRDSTNCRIKHTQKITYRAT